MINYFTITNKKEEGHVCSYCKNRNESYIHYFYDIKIISRRSDCKFFIINDSCKICNMCYYNINKDNGRLLEISNNFYNRFISKNEQFLKTQTFLRSLFSVQNKRLNAVFPELYYIGPERFESRVIYSTGFYAIEEYQDDNDSPRITLTNSAGRGTSGYRPTQIRTHYTPPSFTAEALGFTTNATLQEDSPVIVEEVPYGSGGRITPPGVNIVESDISFMPSPATPTAFMTVGGLTQLTVTPPTNSGILDEDVPDIEDF